MQRSLTWLLRNTPHFRGKPRLVARLVPKRGTHAAKIFGLHVQLDLGDVVERDIYGGIFEPSETRWVKSYLRPGMTFVDAGANIGYYTWLAASLVRESGRVLSFEPSAPVCRKLRSLIAANGLSCVTCFEMALSDREGALTLYIPPASYGNHNASVVPYCEGATDVEVPTTTIDRVVETTGVRRIDLLKVDVEGHELSVLRGAEGTVRPGMLRAVLCEFNPDCMAGVGSSTASLDAWFAAHGFTCVRKFPSKWEPIANKLFVY